MDQADIWEGYRDIVGFALQSTSRESCDQEETAIITRCILKKIPYKRCVRPDQVPEGFIPCGTVEWCGNFLAPEKTVPDYYPDFLQDHLFRKVWKTDEWPLGRRVFVKPADRHKRFNGLVTNGGYRKKKCGPYWCSEVVSFKEEWRYYVADGEVLTGEWYDGDEINTPDAPELNVDIPADFCGALDFGLLSTGELALVEAQPPYACGWYGKDHDLYLEWLAKGWDYLTRQ